MPAKRKAIVASIAALVLLSAALAGTALAKPASPLPADAPARTVSVAGNAQVALKPDVATIQFGAQTRGKDVSAARDENSKLMDKVLAALKANGVDTDKDVKTTNFSINPVYDDSNKKVVEYQIFNGIEVKVRDLDKLGAVMDAAAAAGANTAGGLTFDVEDREAAYNQAIVKAIENARLRAQTLAGSASAKLGSVVSVTESGGYNPYPYYRGWSAYDAAGGVPVSSGLIQISASVSVVFELN